MRPATGTTNPTTSTSKSPAVSGAPTDAPVLLRAPDKPLPYHPWLRLLDVIAGRRDGRAHLAGPQPDPYRLTEDATAWQRHNTHRLEEQLAREDQIHHTLALPLTTRVAELTAAITTAEKALTDTRDALTETQATTVDLTTRRATETHLSDEEIARRRTREHHDDVLTPARTRLTQAENTLDALHDEQEHAAATLAALEEVITARKDRLAEYHQRRRHAYERAYIRRALTTTPPTTAAAPAVAPPAAVTPAAPAPIPFTRTHHT